MESSTRKDHWENIYKTKPLHEVSWFQPKPETSLDFLRFYDVPKSARIIDIGGGDSFLVDHLLSLGYTNITVLDISELSIERAKVRLGILAENVCWMVQDVTKFQATEKYDFWHDRAAFHFLTNAKDIQDYLQTAQQSIKPAGIMVIGTFSENGPKKCSGIDVHQYSEKSMTELIHEHFEKIKCITVDHKTPFDTIQNFIFCSFRKPSAATHD